MILKRTTGRTLTVNIFILRPWLLIHLLTLIKSYSLFHPNRERCMKLSVLKPNRLNDAHLWFVNNSLSIKWQYIIYVLNMESQTKRYQPEHHILQWLRRTLSTGTTFLSISSWCSKISWMWYLPGCYWDHTYPEFSNTPNCPMLYLQILGRMVLKWIFHQNIIEHDPTPSEKTHFSLMFSLHFDLFNNAQCRRILP